MQEIIKSHKADRNIVTIDECQFSHNKIYVYWSGDIRILVNYGGRYFWSTLKLSDEASYGGIKGYSTAKDAVSDYLTTCNENSEKRVYIFNKQCELREWVDKR